MKKRHTDLNELATLLKSNTKDCYLLLEDSSVLFSSDGTFVYMTDLDDEDCDLLEDCTCPDDLKQVLISHHGQEYGKDIFDCLSGNGLFFSDFLNNSDFQI